MSKAQDFAFEYAKEQAEKGNNLTWEDIKRIYDIMGEMVYDSDSPGRGSEAYYREVLRRFNEEKTGCYETTED